MGMTFYSHHATVTNDAEVQALSVGDCPKTAVQEGYSAQPS